VNDIRLQSNGIYSKTTPHPPSPLGREGTEITKYKKFLPQTSFISHKKSLIFQENIYLLVQQMIILSIFAGSANYYFEYICWFSKELF